MLTARKLFLFIMVAIVSSTTLAMVFDNRYIPLIQRPFINVDGRPSHAAGSAFFATASKAIGPVEDDIGIPELNGKFDLHQLSDALDILGEPNPLRAGLRPFNFPYSVTGVIQAQGMEFAYQQKLFSFLSFGFDWLFMRVFSRQLFLLDAGKLFGATIDDIDDVRRKMFKEIGLYEQYSLKFGSGDIDAYLRWGQTFEYVLKMRRIDAWLRTGFLAPTGVIANINSPASIPFGGNGYWGIYVAGEGEFEVREDLNVGLILRLNKRFAKTSLQRFSVAGEPAIFGATVGCARITPGCTFIFYPYVTFEGLRAGLGVRLSYTLMKHMQDSWEDVRSDKKIPVKLDEVQRLSSWKSDYVSLNVFYDFGRVKVCRSVDPIIIFSWDIPSLLFASERAATTHKVSLGVEFNF